MYRTLATRHTIHSQALTGDGWAGVMIDASVTESSGLCSDAEGTCGTWLATPYFVSFLLLGAFVILNLVVAVILENFSSLGEWQS